MRKSLFGKGESVLMVVGERRCKCGMQASVAARQQKYWHVCVYKDVVGGRQQGGLDFGL